MRGALVLLVSLCPCAALAQAVSPYAVDGLAIGQRVHVGSSVYAEYKCEQSQYEGLTVCTRSKQGQSARGKYTTRTTLAHRGDGEVVYIADIVDPAWFDGGGIAAELQRLSTKFGRQPQISTMRGQSADVSGALIATWGTLQLRAISDQDRAARAAGQSINRGYVIDFLSNFKRSLAEGQPIFYYTGGDGFVWSARHDQSGKGVLSFRAVNQWAIDQEIERLDARLAALRQGIDGDLADVRRIAGSGEAAASALATLEADGRSADILADRVKMQELRQRIARFADDERARATHAAEDERQRALQRQRDADARQREQEELARRAAEAARQLAAQAEARRIEEERARQLAAEQRRIDDDAGQRLAALRGQVAELAAGKLPADLREAASALESDLQGAPLATLTPQRLDGFDERAADLARRIGDARNRQALADEIEAQKAALENTRTQIGDGPAAAQIDEALRLARAASPALSADRLRDTLKGLREAAGAAADQQQLVLRRAEAQRIASQIGARLDQTSGEFEGLDELRLRLGRLRQMLGTAGLPQLQSELSALESLYESRRREIDAHVFQMQELSTIVRCRRMAIAWIAMAE